MSRTFDTGTETLTAHVYDGTTADHLEASKAFVYKRKPELRGE